MLKRFCDLCEKEMPGRDNMVADRIQDIDGVTIEIGDVSLFTTLNGDHDICQECLERELKEKLCHIRIHRSHSGDDHLSFDGRDLEKTS